MKKILSSSTLLQNNLQKLRSAGSRFDLAALAAPATAAGLLRTGAGLSLVRLRRVKKSIVATHGAALPLPPEAGPEEIARAAAERLAAWGGAECAAFGLDYHATALRFFRFPFGGAKQIAAVLPHEFAAASPLPTQEYCLTQSAPLPEADGKFSVLASAANRAETAMLARAFAGVGLPLRAIAPAWAALSALWHGLGGEDGVCFVDADGTREAYALLDGGGVRFALCLPPGRDGADHLAGRIAFFLEQAGAAGYAAQRVALAPGENQDEATLRRLEDKLGLPVEKAGATKQIDMRALGADSEGLALAAALGAALLAPRPENEMNFLTGDMAPPPDIPAWHNTARKVCAAACLVLCSLCVFEAAGGLRERGALLPLRQELYRGYRAALPDAAGASSPEELRRLMEARLREWQLDARTQAGGGEGGTALDIIVAVHQALTPDMEGVVESLSMAGERLTLSGAVADFKIADTIREKLAARPLFADVQLKNVQRGEQQKVRYEIEMRVLKANAS